MKINCNVVQFHQTGELVVKVGNKVTDFKVEDRVTSIPFNKKAYEYMLSSQQVGKNVVRVNSK